ncbi:DNA-binding protein [Brevibacillus sp. VP]|uniref:DNA-binding protein n=1 Tax=Brevibacillus sp. VP TaxID=2293326 RepID=UPI000E2EA421|nr:DNA-binding protein [Brevibacillus sp. VP]RFB31981.1 DNA-binding protein [Brevibacillus sp. VP]
MNGIKKEDFPIILDSKDIQQILNIGRRQTYELLNNPPFHVERVGKRGIIKVSRDTFFGWIEGNNSKVTQG